MAKREKKKKTKLQEAIEKEQKRIQRYVKRMQKKGIYVEEPIINIPHSWKGLEKTKKKYSAKELRKTAVWTDPRTGNTYYGLEAIKRKNEELKEREEDYLNRIENHIENVISQWAYRPHTFFGFAESYRSRVMVLIPLYGAKGVASALDIIEENMPVTVAVAYDDTQTEFSIYFEQFTQIVDATSGEEVLMGVDVFEGILGAEQDVFDEMHYKDMKARYMISEDDDYE